MQYAPIALFTYNRADHTKQAVESLLKNEEAKYSDLFIFSDGPKNEKAAEGVKANREYIRSLKNENETLTLRNADATKREKTPYENDNANLNHNLNLNENENPEPLNCTAGAFVPAHEVSDLNSEALAEVLNQRETRLEPACKASGLNQTLLPECKSRAFKSVTIIEREKNWGLANSLIAGITEIVNKYGRVIVVEDDLILSPYFLKFMNDALEKYQDEDRVASISAFLNPVEGEVPNTFFLRYFACWGWATWKRGWDILINDDRVLLKRLRWKKNDFNIGGTGPFYGILYCDKVGLNDSWAVRFYASQFLAGKLQLFPGKTMAVQTGTDGSGTHGTGVDHKYDNMQLCMEPLKLGDIPIEESKLMYNKFSEFYGKGQKRTIKERYVSIKSFVRRLLGIDYR